MEFLSYGRTDDERAWALGKRGERSKPSLDGWELPTPEGLATEATFVGEGAYDTHASLAALSRTMEAVGECYSAPSFL